MPRPAPVALIGDRYTTADVAGSMALNRNGRVDEEIKPVGG
jgi:hypothetical protein